MTDIPNTLCTLDSEGLASRGQGGKPLSQWQRGRGGHRIRLTGKGLHQQSHETAWMELLRGEARREEQVVPVGMGCLKVGRGMTGETCSARERGPVGGVQPGQLDVLIVATEKRRISGK